jgi:hypothetical protein
VSVEAIAMALHHSKAQTAAEMMVLIGVANHDGDGGAWPTVNTLSNYARISHRHVQRILTVLEQRGDIERDVQSGGTAEVAHYDRPNLYHFKVRCPPHCDRTTNHKLICATCKKPLPKALANELFHPKCVPADRVTSTSPGDTQVTRGVTPTSPKPSLEPEPRLNEESLVPERAREAEKDAYGDDLSEAADAPENERQSRTPPASEAFDLATGSFESERCPKRTSSPHAYSKAGECIDCGAPASWRVDQSTGEVA